MQLSVMRDALRKRIGNPSTVDTPDIDLTANINTAYEDIANRYRFNGMRKYGTITTVVGTLAYSLPADCVAVIRIHDSTNERRLFKLDSRREAELMAVSTNGRPQFYLRLATTIELHPVPDGIYSIKVYYKSTVTALVTDVSTPVIPQSWHEGIIQRAKYVYYNDQGDNAKATVALNQFKDWVSEQPVEVDEEKIDYDSGVSVPTLSDPIDPRLDFNSAP